MRLRRLVKGSLFLQDRSQCVVGIGVRGQKKFVSERSIISGNISFKDHRGNTSMNYNVDQYFGPGYNFWGFTADSMAHLNDPFKASEYVVYTQNEIYFTNVSINYVHKNYQISAFQYVLANHNFIDVRNDILYDVITCINK